MTDQQIIDIRDQHLPAQGEPFDCIAFARAVLKAKYGALVEAADKYADNYEGAGAIAPGDVRAAINNAFYAGARHATLTGPHDGDEIRQLCALTDRSAVVAALLRFGNLDKHHAMAVAQALVLKPAGR